MAKRLTNKGFSLVELSVSLVVIGLILGAVSASLGVVRNSKLRVVITEFNEYGTAMNQFKDKFKYWPGDLPNAISTKYWSVSGGNGDWSIPWNTEGYYAWNQLNKAGYVSMTFNSLAGENIPGVNVPASKAFSDGGYHIPGNTIWLGRTRSTDRTCRDIFSPVDTYYIDSKMDDGLPSTGNFMVSASWTAFTGGSWTSVNCISAGKYLISSSAIGCAPNYYYEKK